MEGEKRDRVNFRRRPNHEFASNKAWQPTRPTVAQARLFLETVAPLDQTSFMNWRNRRWLSLRRAWKRFRPRHGESVQLADMSSQTLPH